MSEYGVFKQPRSTKCPYCSDGHLKRYPEGTAAGGAVAGIELRVFDMTGVRYSSNVLSAVIMRCDDCGHVAWFDRNSAMADRK